MSSTSRSKGNYTVKFVKLIENNTRSIFLEKIMLKIWNHNWKYFWINSLKTYTVRFVCPRQVLTTWFYLIWSFFETQKEICNYYSCLIFCMIFEENVSRVMLYYVIKFHRLIVFTSWEIGQYVYCNYLVNILWCINSENNLRFLAKP